ncbi:hypothetical protein NEOLI_003958 [Neolecta irregularis DAH-3]|uniref:Myb-like domain-containing protein n=1 Tax=Neolecta irregularis (strain DAH-3) TaxID=1198029 RepID=A0A1U7LPD6_NEOID|nr:hypothetical protein NEOLI_003958 [Neolecta irregularis DAH-3]|eukprot:OLL24499.1 hypothetical protein NEOLI_003958 [Neolecta irregularis DAH-3]
MDQLGPPRSIANGRRLHFSRNQILDPTVRLLGSNSSTLFAFPELGVAYVNPTEICLRSPMNSHALDEVLPSKNDKRDEGYDATYEHDDSLYLNRERSSPIFENSGISSVESLQTPPDHSHSDSDDAQKADGEMLKDIETKVFRRKFRGRWSVEEDQVIIMLRNKDVPWKNIQRKHFPTSTGNALKVHFAALKDSCQKSSENGSTAILQQWREFETEAYNKMSQYLRLPISLCRKQIKELEKDELKRQRKQR